LEAKQGEGAMMPAWLAHFLMPANVYQVISNVVICCLAAYTFSTFKKISIGKSGLEIEKDDDGSQITLKTILNKLLSFEGRLVKIERENEMQSRDILRINFYLKNQPTETKLISGLRYLAVGGNGKTRKDVLKFIDTHPELYQAIIVLEPTLRLE
jgi:hypothetical protein